MKTGKTLVELATEIERQRKAKQDYIADTRQMHMLDDSRMILRVDGVDSAALPVRPIAHSQIGQRLGIHAKYYDRMLAEAPQLLAQNVNHWFGKAPERRMLRTLDGDVRAFLSDRYARIDNWNVANVVLPIMQQQAGLQVVSCEITERRMYIKATSTQIKLAVQGSRRRGDVVEAGVIAKNSEIGFGRLEIGPYMKFLACTNGMIAEASLQRAHLGRKDDSLDGLLSDETKALEDKALLAKVADVLKAAFNRETFEARIQKMSEQTQQMIKGDPVKAIEVLGEELALTQDEQSSVLRNLIEGGDLSRYGVMNAVTRTAEDVDSYDRATDFEQMGGIVLDLPQKNWERIAVAA